MDTKNFDSIIKGAKEAAAWAQGEPVRVKLHLGGGAEIKQIRAELGMTQKVFAETFALSFDSVRSWESGRRVPDTTTQAYLRTIAYSPETVREALRH